MLYTLIGTAKLNDVDPQAWLAQDPDRIPDYNIIRADEVSLRNSAPGENPEVNAWSRREVRPEVE